MGWRAGAEFSGPVDLRFGLGGLSYAKNGRIEGVGTDREPTHSRGPSALDRVPRSGADCRSDAARSFRLRGEAGSAEEFIACPGRNDGTSLGPATGSVPPAELAGTRLVDDRQSEQRPA